MKTRLVIDQELAIDDSTGLPDFMGQEVDIDEALLKEYLEIRAKYKEVRGRMFQVVDWDNWGRD